MSLPAVLKSSSGSKPARKSKFRKLRSDHQFGDDDAYNNSMSMGDNELTVYANALCKQAKKAFVKLEALRTTARSEEASSAAGSCGPGCWFGVPVTPDYSMTSVDHGCRLERRPERVPERGDARLALAMLSVTFFLQSFSCDIWTPLFEPTLTAFPKWSQTSLGLFNVWTVVVGLLMTVPYCAIINKYGVKTTALSCCVLSTVSAGMRLGLTLLDDATCIVHASTVFLACASVAAGPLTATVSVCCFRLGQRNLVTAVLTSSSVAGSAAGFAFRMLADESLRQTAQQPAAYWRTVVMTTMYSFFLLQVVWTAIVMRWFPRESQNVRASQSLKAAELRFMPSVRFLAKSTVANKNLLWIVLAYALSNSWTTMWFQMIQVTLFAVGFQEQSMGTDCQFWVLVNTCALALSAGYLADRLNEHRKRLGQTLQFLACASILWVVCVLHVRSSGRDAIQLLIGVMFAFPLSWATRSVMYDMATQHAYPLPENMAVGMLEMTKFTFESCAYVLMMILPEFHLVWLHGITAVASVSSLIFLSFVKPDHCYR